MTDGWPELAIVVVNFGSSALLEEHLAAIDRTALPPSIVVVVDNRTTAGERGRVAALAAQHGWILLTPDTNLGFGGGMNQGVARAKAEGCSRFLLLNPDVSVDASAIELLVRSVVDAPLTLVSPRLDWPDGSIWFAGGQLDRGTGLTRSRPDHLQEGAGRWLSGACLLVDRALWDLLGGFDERYFLYWEDVDLSQRTLQRGGQLLVVHEAVGVHSVGGTQRTEGREGKSPTYCRYMCRNRLLFATLHVPARSRLRWLAHTPRYTRLVTFRHGRRVALRRPSLALAACYGSGVGVAMVLRSLVRDAWAARRR